MSRKDGFTLVEMGVVLVILALLVGALMIGSNMIAAAKLRAASTEAQTYMTAVTMFHEKYAGLPGDISNATTFWGDNATYCSDASIVNGSPGTCNGDGSQIINSTQTPNVSIENMQFWNQLAQAGLIEGRYTGINRSTPDSLGQYDTGEAGISVPSSDVQNSARWQTVSFATGAPNATAFNRNANVTLRLVGAPFSPDELWSIDQKLDDGKAGMGILFTNWACSLASNANDFTADYRLNNSTLSCDLYLIPSY